MTTPERWNPDTQGWSNEGARPMSFSLPTGSDPASVRARVEAMELLLGKLKKNRSNIEFLLGMNL